MRLTTSSDFRRDAPGFSMARRGPSRYNSLPLASARDVQQSNAEGNRNADAQQ